MDADLQDSPEEIPTIQMDGWRKFGSVVAKTTFKLFNWAARKTSG
jgi:hypothetical protein